MKHTNLLLLLFIPVAIFAQEPVESDFFTDGLPLVDQHVDLVKDYAAVPSDGQDDSEIMQQAIDDMTKLNMGGEIYIPAGTFHLMGILLKDNVHLVIDHNATIVPTTPTGTIFSMGLSRKGKNAAVTINNVSIRGKGGRYTIDFTKARVDEKLTFVNCRNVNNFMVADFEVFDHYSKMSCVTLNNAYYDNGDKENQENWDYWQATNGVVKNGMSYDTHIGYGLIQMQVGKNIFFKDLDSNNGGITLRMESGASGETPDYINVNNVWARNISCHNGGSTFAMGSHVKANGYANLKHMTAFGCARVGGVGLGFTSSSDAEKGIFVGDTLNVEACKADPHNCLIRGRYNPTSKIDSVHAVYGTSAVVKSKNFQLIPCEVRHLLSKSPRPDNNGYQSPSYSVMTVADSLIYHNVTHVTHEGFPFPIEQAVYLGVREKISDAQCNALSVEKKVEHLRVYPNPASTFLNLSNFPHSSFTLLDISGKVVLNRKETGNGIMDISALQPGCYILHIQSGNKTEFQTIIKP